ncbi:MAG: hypothetical protein AVDCRST_MAG50-2628, partial [uncultured Acidimicrobiales bacterium]
GQRSVPRPPPHADKRRGTDGEPVAYDLPPAPHRARSVHVRVVVGAPRGRADHAELRAGRRAGGVARHGRCEGLRALPRAALTQRARVPGPRARSGEGARPAAPAGDRPPGHGRHRAEQRRRLAPGHVAPRHRSPGEGHPVDRTHVGHAEGPRAVRGLSRAGL